MTKKTNHYIDNKQFLQALIDYRETSRLFREEDPPIPNYKCMVNVSIRLQNIYQEKDKNLYHTHFVMR